ncbi:lipoprotein [Spiroplasma tabanidicola]|uniref:Lipoprotein n=1 Tax=Spiroplasma tabanidicola TaxID=324079 RepID=A0A6I6C7U3_9MOLU|nr:lipoprotein [Spiroplasma tabanidicola]QGS52290.1 hypothetical protein STABA_v1c09370 [Spiroplasma tabanidicola]
MKQLISLLGSIGLIATSSSIVVACSKKAKSEFSNSITPNNVKYGEKQSFNVEIINPSEYDSLSVEELQGNSYLTSIKVEKNKGDISKFVVSYMGKKVTEKAIIKLSYGDLVKEVNLKVEKNTLEGLIKIKDLGRIKMANDTPTKDELLNAIENANSEIYSQQTLSKSDFEIQNASKTEATIKASGQNLEGTIELTYRNNAKTQLNSLIKITNLGQIEGKELIPSEEEIWNKVKEVNITQIKEEEIRLESLILNSDFTITKYNSNAAINSSPASSKIVGNVQVNYTYKQKSGI